GFLKRTKIGDNVIYNLKFKLPLISEPFYLLIYPIALDINHNVTTHSKVHQALLKLKKSKVPWTEDKDIKLLQI
ncbi:hypothetical protein F5882DRAFT_308124, partial [Hyaloscypha sp. PMI_1271]